VHGVFAELGGWVGGFWDLVRSGFFVVIVSFLGVFRLRAVLGVSPCFDVLRVCFVVWGDLVRPFFFLYVPLVGGCPVLGFSVLHVVESGGVGCIFLGGAGEGELGVFFRVGDAFFVGGAALEGGSCLVRAGGLVGFLGRFWGGFWVIVASPFNPAAGV